MQIYSDFYQPFLKQLSQNLKEIIQTEVGLSFKRKRFIYNGYSYPIRLVLFEGKELGYFSNDKWIIGLNKNLIFQDQEIVLNTLRHEIAHLLCFIKHGSSVQDHGNEYKEICKTYGWDKSVFSAALVLEDKSAEDFENKSGLIRKVEKLLSLSSSNNQYESQKALEKALKLLQENEIQHYQLGRSGHEEGDEFVMKPILDFKRKTAKFQCIADILEQFFVYPVFNYGKNGASLEITGSRSAVEIAEYVGNYLDKELELIWKSAKSKYDLKSKNSFFYGLGRGYQLKLAQSKAKSHDLVIIDNKLANGVKNIYGSLSKKSSGLALDEGSLDHGKRVGEKLNIRFGLKSKTLKTELLI